MVSKRLSRQAGHRRKFLAIIDDTPECERALAYASKRAQSTGGVVVLLYVIEPELVIREGKPAEEIHKLIEEDQDIAILVLAAGMGKEGPGPLVTAVAGKGTGFAIPVTVVPQGLSDEDIENLA